jgi:hypothetical protein
LILNKKYYTMGSCIAKKPETTPSSTLKPVNTNTTTSTTTAAAPVQPKTQKPIIHVKHSTHVPNAKLLEFDRIAGMDDS